MSSSSHKGLQSIYAALDSHRYERAIKLCHQQPPTNTMAMTLLAHAYAKSGQRYKALSTIQSDIFGQCGAAVFPELQLEVQYAAAREISTASGTSQQQALASQQAQAASAKKPIATSAAAKNKGKKKVHTQPQQTQPAASSTLSTVVPKAWDLIDQLDWTPTLPADWEQCLPPRNATFQPDVTLLATLSMTMLSILKLPLTAYQLYCWAATATTASSDDVALFTRQAYLNGLAVLIAPQYANIQASILSNMQVLALQVARYQPTALLWAAQTALWQLTFPVVVPPAKTNTTDRNNNDKDDGDAEKHAQRLAMLPRLAESLASKCVAHYCDSLSSSDCKSLANTTTATNSDDASTESNNSSSLLSTESFLLYIRTLDWQSKWTEMLDALEERLRTDTAGKQMSPPRQTILELKVQALLKMENRSTAIRETVEVLLTMYPDDWEYWKQHLQSSIAESDGDVERGCVVTEEFVAKILQIQSSRFLSRGPSLMQVELAATRMKNTVTSGAAISALMESIIRYGNDFSSCASCIFSDLCPYLEVFTASCSADQANALLKWSKELRNVEPASDDPKKRRNQLQVYIFAVQVNYKVLVKFTELWGDELPSWEELVQVWKSFQTFENMEKVDQAQKESRPADELILLAVQRLLCSQPSVLDRMIAASLLESAIRYSPYNAYLKICAMFVYGDLDAASLSWDIYNELYIKHVQNESCAYLILPLLRSGGLYHETVSVCQEIIGLQLTSGREASDFAARAMESGAVSKAEEFLVFYRDRMTKSLTSLESKGLILDAAPMLLQESDVGVLGSAHGIVGGEFDMQRVKEMVAEVHNPYGAFSLLQLRGSVKANLMTFSENRDFAVLSFEILCKREFETPEQIVGESIRRANQHRLLIRAALCVDATRGPKKGKATKMSTELGMRCISLLTCVNYAAEPIDFSPPGCCKLLQAMRELCLAIVALSAGMTSKGEHIFDTLGSREEAVMVALTSACALVQAARSELENTKELTVARASRLLPDSIAPFLALFQMFVKLADLFGWGPRKRKTKRCAAGVADLALSFTLLIVDMKSCLEGFLFKVSPFDPAVADNLSDIIELDILKETCDGVFESQRCTLARIESILDYIKGCLDAIDVDE